MLCVDMIFHEKELAIQYGGLVKNSWEIFWVKFGIWLQVMFIGKINGL